MIITILHTLVFKNQIRVCTKVTTSLAPGAKPQRPPSRVWRVGLFDFGSGLTKKFGFRVGFGYWLYLAVLGCTGIRLHWAVLGCGGVGLMSLQMIHEAYIPVIM